MNTKRLSNRELVGRLVKAGADDELWGEFVSRFRSRIRLVVLRSFQTEAERSPGLDSGSPQEALEDMTQEVFVRLLEGERRALSLFEGRSEQAVYTYLSTIAVNLVRDHFKKLRTQKKPKGLASLANLVSRDADSGAPTYEQALISDAPGPERFVASQELREEIRAAIDEASNRDGTTRRDRVIFQLFFVEGLTMDEIARNRSIRLSPSGVEKCIRRIRKALKSRILPASSS